MDTTPLPGTPKENRSSVAPCQCRAEPDPGKLMGLSFSMIVLPWLSRVGPGPSGRTQAAQVNCWLSSEPLSGMSM